MAKKVEKVESENNGLKNGMKLQCIETDREGNIFVVDNEQAQGAMVAYFQDEVGRYIDEEFKTNDKTIAEKVEKLHKDLSNLIDDRLAKIAEDVASRMLSHKIREEINQKVNEKLGLVTKLINAEMESEG